VQLEAIGDTAPVDFERHFGLDRRSVEQRVYYVVIVLHIQTGNAQRGLALLKINVHAVVWNGYRPKEAFFVNSGIEIVDLLGIRVRSRTREDIQSNESESAVVNFAVAPDIRSGHETVVGVEEQMTWLVARFGPGSSASYICQANETLEVGD